MLKSLKSRVLLVLVTWLALSHLASLWLFARKHEEAASLLQDALIADRIALTTRLLEGAGPDDRARLLARLNSPLVTVAPADTRVTAKPGVEGTRPHHFEHLVGLFLDRPTHDGLKTTYRAATGDGAQQTLLKTLSATLNPEPHHLPAGTLDSIRTTGTVTTEVTLSDSVAITFASPLLSANPFTIMNLWGPLAAMLLSVVLSGAWVIARATRPLMALAGAADRLGADIHAPPLTEDGALEVQTAARAFNGMQERIQRLIEDRTAFAAALAHDIGTPITRLVLRLDDIPESELKSKMGSDIGQMQRMIRATLTFARSDFQAESSERFDVAALMQSIADDLSDTGAQVETAGVAHLPVMSKPVALRRAVTNIAENAVKYGQRATITLQGARGETDDFVITVDDEGPGIPANLHDEAFRPFRRLSVTEGVEGTGLGLSVARSVARSLGGDIALANRPSGGLRVTLTLPRR